MENVKNETKSFLISALLQKSVVPAAWPAGWTEGQITAVRKVYL